MLWRLSPQTVVFWVMTLVVVVSIQALEKALYKLDDKTLLSELRTSGAIGDGCDTSSAQFPTEIGCASVALTTIVWLTPGDRVDREPTQDVADNLLSPILNTEDVWHRTRAPPAA